MLSAESCALFDLPFFQFAQMKKYCPEEIPQIKANYKKHWAIWKALHLEVARRLGSPFAEPHIEKWCNGWQVRAHFFAYYKYAFNQNSAAILSVILNRRRLQVSLDWHCYRANRSQIRLEQYRQWQAQFDRKRYQDFEVWKGSDSEYADFPRLKEVADLTLENDQDFWCIGKNVEKADLADLDSVACICQTIKELQPLYDTCHQ